VCAQRHASKRVGSRTHAMKGKNGASRALAKRKMVLVSSAAGPVTPTSTMPCPDRRLYRMPQPPSEATVSGMPIRPPVQLFSCSPKMRAGKICATYAKHPALSTFDVRFQSAEHNQSDVQRGSRARQSWAMPVMHSSLGSDSSMATLVSS
jgi:hypothetical protein